MWRGGESVAGAPGCRARAGRALTERRSAITLAALAAVTIALSFASQWYLVRSFGAGRSTDAYYASLTIPMMVVQIVGNQLAFVLVPLFAVGSPELRSAEVWSATIGVTSLFAAFAVLLAITAPRWLPMTVPGFDRPGLDLTLLLVRVNLIGFASMAPGVVLRSAYNARHVFIWPAVGAAIAAFAGLLVVVLGLPRWGVIAASLGFALRSAVETVLMIPELVRAGRPRRADGFLTLVFRRVRPLVLGAAYDRTEPAVDRFLASMAPAGGLSLLALASQTYGAIAQVINRSIVSPVAPQLAQLAHARRSDAFADLVRRRFQLIGVLSLLALVGIAVVGRPGIALLFGFWRASPGADRTLWTIMLLLSGQILHDSGSYVLHSGFYGYGDTVTPVRVGAAAYTVGVVMKVIGFWAGGVLGLAAATSLYLLLRVGGLYVFLRRGLARGAVSGAAIA